MKEDCDICTGTGETEQTEIVMEGNDPATRRFEGTGRLINCPNCNPVTAEEKENHELYAF